MGLIVQNQSDNHTANYHLCGRASAQKKALLVTETVLEQSEQLAEKFYAA
nr:hypothetical protein [Acinetobacter indicus]